MKIVSRAFILFFLLKVNMSLGQLQVNKEYSNLILSGDSLKKLGNYAGAIECYQKAIQIDSTSSDTYETIADIYFLNEQQDLAIASYSKAYDINPNCAECLFYRANIKTHTGDFQGAIKDYSLVVLNYYEMDPSKLKDLKSNSYYFRGLIKSSYDDYTEALQDYNESIKLNATDGERYSDRGICQIKLGNIDEACKDFAKSQDLGYTESKDYIQKYCSKKDVNTNLKIKMTKKNGVFYIPCKVNGLAMEFIFDTGASDVSISITEAAYMYKNGLLKDEQIKGTQKYVDANGLISAGTNIIIEEIEIGGLKLKNVNASVSSSANAPLLLGQSLLEKLGNITIDYQNSQLVIGERTGVSDKKVNDQASTSFSNSKPDDFDFVRGCKYLKPTVKTLTLLTRSDLKTFSYYLENLKETENCPYYYNGPENNCEIYGTNTRIPDGVLTVEKCLNGMVTFTWMDTQKNTSILKDLSIELSKYYIGESDDSTAKYRLNINDETYFFYINRNPGMEFVFVKMAKKE